jgi:DNA-binding IclR family transcriptional regulator
MNENVPATTDNATKDQDREGASSLSRMLSILDLFTMEQPVWSTAEILEASGSSRSTGYRYIKALTSAGLLGAVGNGHYMLGSRIIELDLLIRRTDPLLQASEGVLDRLVQETGQSALLCMLFQNSVLCINERRAPSGPATLFSRGQRRPLFRGAMSKVVLAYLPTHRLRSIFAKRKDMILDANLGQTWDEFREGLARIRSEAYCRSEGEFQPGVVGISAPVFNAEESIIGSLGVAWSKADVPKMNETAIVEEVKQAAELVTRRMRLSDPRLGMPPRAVG